jgi:hypothetical protein
MKYIKIYTLYTKTTQKPIKIKHKKCFHSLYLKLKIQKVFTRNQWERKGNY